MHRILAERHPDAHCELDHASPLQLLVATILSAQCTDARVNLVTPALFARYPTAADYAGADRAELEEMIRSTGFFRAKTNALISLGAALVAEHGGQVPGRLAQLVTLPGVGRKTANVVLNVAFGEPTVAVDTHVLRVSNRTGLATGSTPLEVEMKLLERVPAEYLADAHHWLILHGRYVCLARKPRCAQCAVARFCDSAPDRPLRLRVSP